LLSTQGGGGAESLWERQKREAAEVRAEVEADPFVREVMAAFPGAEILSVRQTLAPEPVTPLAMEDDDED
jgi:DNA polymerase-3 subunit gamma/tau